MPYPGCPRPGVSKRRDEEMSPGGCCWAKGEVNDGLPASLHSVIHASLSQGFLRCPERSLAPPWDLTVNLGLLGRKKKV